jgi:DNA polymerase V
MFALVDCNNFYASCERVFEPGLNGRPVVVLSNNDGCVIARSAEAKAIGIAMGALPFEIKALLDEHKVVVRSSNYVLYGDMSNRVMETLRAFSPNIENYSIDESFLDLHHMHGVDLVQHAHRIRDTVFQHTGIPVSVGLAPTKTLAKAANRMGKKGNGVFLIGDEATRVHVLRGMEAGDVWGIGRRHAFLLGKFGVHTALHLANANPAWVRSQLTVVGARLQEELRGIPCTDLELLAPPKQMICTSRSFGKMQTRYEDVEEAVMNFASRCAAKLRRQGSAANILNVFVETNRFREDLPQYNRSRSTALPVATSDSMELCGYAKVALRSIFRAGMHYKKAGCIVQGLVPEKEMQVALFDPVDRDRGRVVMTAIDAINSKQGRDRVRIAAQGYARTWRLRSENLSPAYTTRWSELMPVMCE